MTFFNKKEEVIEIELTAYGKYLLSKGRWRPKFYTFSDDNVTYDPEFLNLSEKRKETNERIQNLTPNLRSVLDHSSAETRVMRLNGHIIENNDYESARALVKTKIGEVPLDDVYGKDFINDISMAPDGGNLIRNFIGTSEIGSQKPPAWSVVSLNTEIFNSNVELSSSGPNRSLRIPQLEMNIDVNVYARKIEQNVSDTFFKMQAGIEDRIYFTDGYELEIEDRSIVLKVEEENVRFEKENFDVEFYLVEDEREVQIGAARATFTITNLSNLTTGATVSFTDTEGQSYTLTCTGIPGNPAPATGVTTNTNTTSPSFAVAEGSINDTAHNMFIAINALDNFKASVKDNVVIVDQAEGGRGGNVTVTLNDDGADGMTVTDFTGGGPNKQRKEETLIKLFCSENDLDTVDQKDLIDTYLEISYDDDIPAGELIRDNGSNAEKQGGLYLPRTGIPRSDATLDNSTPAGQTRDIGNINIKPFGTSTTTLLGEAAEADADDGTFDDDSGDGGVCD